MSKSLKLKDSHLFLTSSSDVNTIIRPLTDHFGVSSLVYQKNFNDGSEIRLSNQPAWIKHFYEQGYYQASGFEKHPNEYQSGLVVWSSLTHHQPILTAAREHNIDHGMTLIQKTPQGVEYFFLGTTSDKSYVTNLLLNNMEFLNHFTAYFKEQAASLIKKSLDNLIIIPHKYDQKVLEQGIPYQHLKSNINFEKIFKIKKFHIDSNTSLSGREIACAKLLLQGKSARQMAMELFISPRTVESHLKHLKEKLKCQFKDELIAKLLALHINYM